MKLRNFHRVLAFCLGVAMTLPAAAAPLAYAANERGAFGWAIDAGSRGATERLAMQRCGGAANGCKIVMSRNGDCMAAIESRGTPSQPGYWYWVAYTTAQNAYARTSELQRVRGLVYRWCTGVGAGPPFNTCRSVHSDCASYIRNLN